MLEKLAFIEERLQTIEAQLAEPSLYDDPQAAAKLLKEQKEIAPIVDAYRLYKRAQQDAADAQENVPLARLLRKLRQPAVYMSAELGAKNSVWERF